MFRRPAQPMTIVCAGAPVLRQPCRALTEKELCDPETRTLIARMKATMRAAPGVGLAAPQVGLGISLAVIEDRSEYHRKASAERLARQQREPVPFHVLANPTLKPIPNASTSKQWEGCLSVPGYLALVERHLAVRVETLDGDGQPMAIEATGWYARILQHEIDHLRGTLYLDRMTPRSLCREEIWSERWADAPVQEARSALGIDG